MGAACAADSRQRFGLDRQVDQFLALYEEIIVDRQSHQKFKGRQASVQP